MTIASKRKTSLSAAVPGSTSAQALRASGSAATESDLQQAETEARRHLWLEENRAAFAAQADWHDRNGHPLAEILAAPGHPSWSR